MHYTMDQDIETVLFSQEQIQQRVAELGAQIAEDYRDKDPIVVGILRGCFIFMADLVRAAQIPCTLEFLAVSSYGKGTTSGEVCLTRDFPMPIEGRHILILEDILDSGRTLSYVVRLLQQRNPASVEICAFLDKPSRRVTDIQAKYSGYEVPDAFVVGYGLDYADRYRNLPYIGILKPEIYNS